MILVGQKDKTQAVERPPGDVHLRLVAVDVINGNSKSAVESEISVLARVTTRLMGSMVNVPKCRAL